MQCPHCGSANVRKSYKRASVLLFRTYRCRRCKRHFEIPTSRRQLLAMAGGAGVLLVVAVVALKGLIGPDDDAVTPPDVLNAASTPDTRDYALAKNGDRDAQFKIGMGYWTNADYQRSFPWIKAAAQKGHVGALYSLGLAYLYGHGTVQNYRFALDQFLAAAERGHLEAQYTLGIMYREGRGVTSNPEQAYIWLNVAAARGHGSAAMDRDRLAISMSPEETVRAQEASVRELQKMPGTATGATDNAARAAETVAVPEQMAQGGPK